MSQTFCYDVKLAELRRRAKDENLADARRLDKRTLCTHFGYEGPIRRPARAAAGRRAEREPGGVGAAFVRPPVPPPASAVPTGRVAGPVRREVERILAEHGAVPDPMDSPAVLVAELARLLGVAKEPEPVAAPQRRREEERGEALPPAEREAEPAVAPLPAQAPVPVPSALPWEGAWVALLNEIPRWIDVDQLAGVYRTLRRRRSKEEEEAGTPRTPRVPFCRWLTRTREAYTYAIIARIADALEAGRPGYTMDEALGIATEDLRRLASGEATGPTGTTSARILDAQVALTEPWLGAAAAARGRETCRLVQRAIDEYIAQLAAPALAYLSGTEPDIEPLLESAERLAVDLFGQP